MRFWSCPVSSYGAPRPVGAVHAGKLRTRDTANTGDLWDGPEPPVPTPGVGLPGCSRPRTPTALLQEDDGDTGCRQPECSPRSTTHLHLPSSGKQPGEGRGEQEAFSSGDLERGPRGPAVPWTPELGRWVGARQLGPSGRLCSRTGPQAAGGALVYQPTLRGLSQQRETPAVGIFLNGPADLTRLLLTLEPADQNYLHILETVDLLHVFPWNFLPLRICL